MSFRHDHCTAVWTCWEPPDPRRQRLLGAANPPRLISFAGGRNRQLYDEPCTAQCRVLDSH